METRSDGRIISRDRIKNARCSNFACNVDVENSITAAPGRQLSPAWYPQTQDSVFQLIVNT